jgi:hypothetical protein
MWPAAELLPWITIIRNEFQAYVSTLSHDVLEIGHVLSSFDTYDIFNIAIATTDLNERSGAPHRTSSQAQSSAAYDFDMHIRLLSVGGMRFPFGHRLCSLLVEHLRLMGSDGSGDTGKLHEDLLSRCRELAGSRMQGYMMTLMGQGAHVTSTVQL